ncbi:MAG TPA: hypothetical protein VLF18_04865 [Tahibacter sp.]|uniref:hypothetical protein n=1 Tax=Tahibacter sp. TaxID=2056211 RepID=UPI002D023A20|nr:hypothetical protein [Tahibacter sp.]HSX59514.1 hypothetical protein [Tahibacter sp.]
MWGRALAGLVPGFFVSAGLIGLIGWSLPGPWQSALVGSIAGFFPLWTFVIAASFAFADARRAWLCWSVLAFASFAALALLRATALVA